MKTVKYTVATFFTFLLAAIIMPLAFLFGLIYSIIKNFGSNYVFNVLISIDESGNAVCSALFNLIWIESKSENKFGSPEETISSVLGKNKAAKTLTWFGSFISWLLDTLQKNHVENSIMGS